MPKYPIYVNLLSKEAQAVINQVHAKTLPALRLLEAEGFSRKGYVDIFDAGPTVEASINTIKSVQQSARYQVLIGEVNDDNRYIAINTESKTSAPCKHQYRCEKQQTKWSLASKLLMR